MYCTVLYSIICTVLYCTVLYCTVLYCTVLYCTVLYCTVLYCNSKYIWRCQRLLKRGSHPKTEPFCAAAAPPAAAAPSRFLHLSLPTVLYCIVLYCNLLNQYYSDPCLCPWEFSIVNNLSFTFSMLLLLTLWLFQFPDTLFTIVLIQ